MKTTPDARNAGSLSTVVSLDIGLSESVRLERFLRYRAALPGWASSARTISGARLNSRLSSLRGRRVLVVENEYVIAANIDTMLTNVGAETLGPVPLVSDALCKIAAKNRIDGALLDVSLPDGEIWPVVDKLLADEVPMVLSSGYDGSNFPRAYAQLLCCEKPIGAQELVRALADTIAGRASPIL